MMLKDKVAVVYGARGAVGGTVARAYAAEGAKSASASSVRRPRSA